MVTGASQSDPIQISVQDVGPTVNYAKSTNRQAEEKGQAMVSTVHCGAYTHSDHPSWLTAQYR